MREAMRDERVKPFEVQQRVEKARARRVAVIDGLKISAKDCAKFGLLCQHALERLRDQPGVDVGLVESLSKAVADGFLEHLVAEDGRKYEAAEGWLSLHRCLCLGADLRPDRINDLDLW